MEWDEDRLLEVRDRHEEWLMKQAGVQGTCLGVDETGRLCIKILTNQMDAASREALRLRLGKVPVSFDDTGEICIQPTDVPEDSASSSW